jgi:hypothetical protein
MNMTRDDIYQAVRKANRSDFHIKSDGWVGHSTDRDDCYQCNEFARTAAAAVFDLLTGVRPEVD